MLHKIQNPDSAAGALARDEEAWMVVRFRRTALRVERSGLNDFVRFTDDWRTKNRHERNLFIAI